WVENYAWVCYDPTAQVGFMAHLGRAPFEPDLWRGTAVAFLPGGELAIAKAVGRPAEPEQAGNGQLSLSCAEPFQRWRIGFEGAGRRTSRAEVASRLVPDNNLALLRADLEFTALCPVWDLGAAMGNQDWGHAHHEQAGRYRGTLTVADRDYRIDCTGFRDHTTGPRDFGHLRRTFWAHGEFPSGRVFCVLRIWDPADNVSLNQGFIYDGQRLIPAVPTELPTLTAPDGSPHRFSLHAQAPDPIEITGEVVHSTAFMLHEPNDLAVGTDLAGDNTKVIVEAPTRYVWDGEEGWGWLERSRRINELQR
ncbi:MAG TPA: hypothetical protein VGH89_39620, partial [Pseudonocardia sp.]